MAGFVMILVCVDQWRPTFFVPRSAFQVAVPPESFQLSVNIAKPYTSFPACSNFPQHFLMLAHNKTTRLHMPRRQLFLSQTRAHTNLLDKQWPWHEPNIKMNQIQNRWISMLKKVNCLQTQWVPATGRMGLASRSQECNNWFQGVGKLQGGYQSLFCTWT